MLFVDQIMKECTHICRGMLIFFFIFFLQDGRTPLILATQMCHPRICQLLLERGADITVRDKQNK